MKRHRLRDLEAEVAALTERVEALEGVRPTVELVEWSKVPDAEPVDIVALWEARTERYAYGFNYGDDWRGYL